MDYTTLRLYERIRKAVIPPDICEPGSDTYSVISERYTRYLKSKKHGLLSLDADVAEYDLSRIRTVVPTATQKDIPAACAILMAFIVFRGWNIASADLEQLADSIYSALIRGELSSLVVVDVKPKIDSLFPRLNKRVIDTLVKCLEDDFRLVLRKYFEDIGRSPDGADRLFTRMSARYRKRLLNTSYFSIIDEIKRSRGL